MKLTQRTLVLGAVVAALLVVVALQVVDPVFVVLALAVLALVGLVAWGRVRSQERADEEAGWASGGDEWGLSSGDDADDEVVDLDDRLSAFGGGSTTMPSRERPFGREPFARPPEAFEPAPEPGWEAAPEETAAPAEQGFEREFEGLVEEYGTTGRGIADYGSPRPSVADYAEPAADDEVEYEEYEEYEDEPEPARRTASIFAAPGVIDEESLDSDDAILAASEATRLQYDDVLTREDANAETREILTRVASLLAKYE